MPAVSQDPETSVCLGVFSFWESFHMADLGDFLMNQRVDRDVGGMSAPSPAPYFRAYTAFPMLVIKTPEAFLVERG
jgi:hypothetical protein